MTSEEVLRQVVGLHLAFDLLAWMAAGLFGALIYRWRIGARYSTYTRVLGAGYFLSLLSGGLMGGYLFGTANLYLSSVPGIGRSVLGALCGAIVAVECYKLACGIKGSTGIIFAVPLLIGIAVGRWGCFFAGLEDQTHGTATRLAVGYDFGDGVARHPVQLYESATMLLAFGVAITMLKRRSKYFFENGFYLTVGWYGLQRFVLEFLKPYGSIIGPLNVYHLLCVFLIGYSAYMVYGYRNYAP